MSVERYFSPPLRFVLERKCRYTRRRLTVVEIMQAFHEATYVCVDASSDEAICKQGDLYFRPFCDLDPDHLIEEWRKVEVETLGEQSVGTLCH